MKKTILIALLSASTLMASITIEHHGNNKKYFEKVKKEILLKLQKMEEKLKNHQKCVSDTKNIAEISDCGKKLYIHKRAKQLELK